jgi:serine/threonine-protein kinase 24/25/MST4
LGITCIELACGKPPHAHVHPLQVMNIITRSPPPQLEGEQFSRHFREFVSLCLLRDPERRPPISLLLKHAFIKKAKKTALIKELFN